MKIKLNKIHRTELSRKRIFIALYLVYTAGTISKSWAIDILTDIPVFIFAWFIIRGWKE